MSSRISMQEFLKIMQQVKIIDIRSMENYNHNHIPGAINIPWEGLIITPERYLNKKEAYYIYCQRGHRTKQVCRMLANMGYKVVEILGGYEEWILSR